MKARSGQGRAPPRLGELGKRLRDGAFIGWGDVPERASYDLSAWRFAGGDHDSDAHRPAKGASWLERDARGSLRTFHRGRGCRRAYAHRDSVSLSPTNVSDVL